MNLQDGRPTDLTGRLPKEIRVYDFLDTLNISYQRVDHEAAMTMEACEEIDQALGDNTSICKNLFLCNRQATDFYLILIPGNKPPGSVSVMGLMNDIEHKVQLLIDEDILKKEYFGCHPCVNTSSLKFKTTDLMERIIPALEHTPKMVTLG